MDKKKFKRIIAREGLILLGVIIIGIFLGSRAYNIFWTRLVPTFELPVIISLHPQATLGGAILDSIKSLYLIYLLFWVAYLIFRFIKWAIRTLKEKE